MADQPAVRLLIVDLEATCWERDPPAPHEVIEIGAVCFDAEQGVLGEFQRFVRPKLRPVLSDFCKQLTTIRQEDVDGAAAFPQALAELCAFAEPFAPYTLAAWGAYDGKQLREDCSRHGVRYPFAGYVNLKKAFAVIHDCRPQGMAGALRMAGLPLEGTHHRGIDDVRNIARLAEYLAEKAGERRMLAAGKE